MYISCRGLSAAFCRVCPTLKEIPGKPSIGSVFLYVFDREKPYTHNNNTCMVHVVAPTMEDFVNADDFLQAVKLTSTNLMKALCDFNGYVKHSKTKQNLQELGVVR